MWRTEFRLFCIVGDLSGGYPPLGPAGHISLKGEIGKPSRLYPNFEVEDIRDARMIPYSKKDILLPLYVHSSALSTNSTRSSTPVFGRMATSYPRSS